MTLGRKTGGRQKGVPNRVTADVKALAEQYSASAIEALVALMQHAEHEQTRLGAARELLDRAVGRPAVHAEVSGTLAATSRDVKAMSDEELLAIVQAARSARAMKVMARSIVACGSSPRDSSCGREEVRNDCGNKVEKASA
jgi:hypothetical protein